MAKNLSYKNLFLLVKIVSYNQSAPTSFLVNWDLYVETSTKKSPLSSISGVHQWIGSIGFMPRYLKERGLEGLIRVKPMQ